MDSIPNLECTEQWLKSIGNQEFTDEMMWKIVKDSLHGITYILRNNPTSVEEKLFKSYISLVDRLWTLKRKQVVADYNEWIIQEFSPIIAELRGSGIVSRLIVMVLTSKTWKDWYSDRSSIERLNIQEWLSKGDDVIVLKMLNNLFSQPPPETSPVYTSVIDHCRQKLKCLDVEIAQQAGLLYPRLLDARELWEKHIESCNREDLYILYGVTSCKQVEAREDELMKIVREAYPHGLNQAIALDVLQNLLNWQQFDLVPLLHQIISYPAGIDSALMHRRTRLLTTFLETASRTSKDTLFQHLLSKPNFDRQFLQFTSTFVQNLDGEILINHADQVWKALYPLFHSPGSCRKAIQTMTTFLDKCLLDKLEIYVKIWLPIIMQDWKESNDVNFIPLIISLHTSLPINVLLQVLGDTSTEPEIFLRVMDKLKGSKSLLTPNVGKSMVGIGTFNLLDPNNVEEALEWICQVMKSNCKTQTPELRVKILSDFKIYVGKLKLNQKNVLLNGLFKYAIQELNQQGSSPLRQFFHLMLLRYIFELSKLKFDNGLHEELWNGLHYCMESNYTNVRFAVGDVIQCMNGLNEVWKRKPVGLKQWLNKALENLNSQIVAKTEASSILLQTFGDLNEVVGLMETRMRYWKDESDSLINLSIHGHLLTCRNFKDARLYDLSLKALRIAIPFVTNDAPEGFIDQEWQEDDYVSKSQLLQHSAYLTIKYGCMVLENQGEMDTIVKEEMLEAALTARHKGVLKPLCQLVVSGLNGLNEDIVLKAMDKTSITRRSAGLATLIVTYLKFNPKDLSTVMEILIKCTRDEKLNRRIHGLNCLKGICKDSKLFQQVSMENLSILCLVAMETFHSKDWNENNSGLMLFVSLMERLNRFNWYNFSRLLPNFSKRLLYELERSVKDETAMSIPILTLIQQLVSFPLEFKDEELKRVLFEACGAKMFQVRRLAGVALGKVLKGLNLGNFILKMALDSQRDLCHGLLGVVLELSEDLNVDQEIWKRFEMEGWSIKVRILEILGKAGIEGFAEKVTEVALDHKQHSLVRQRALQVCKDNDLMLKLARDDDAQVRQRALQMISANDAQELIDQIQKETHPECLYLLYKLLPRNEELQKCAIRQVEETKSMRLISSCIPHLPEWKLKELIHLDDYLVKCELLKWLPEDEWLGWEKLLQDDSEYVRIQAARRLSKGGIPFTPEVTLYNVLEEAMRELKGQDLARFIASHVKQVDRQDVLFAADEGEVAEPKLLMKWIESRIEKK